MGLGDQAKEVSIAVETPRTADLDDFQALLIVVEEKFVADGAGGSL